MFERYEHHYHHEGESNALTNIARSNYEKALLDAKIELSKKMSPETYDQMKEMEKSILAQIIYRETSEENELANWEIFELKDPERYILSFNLNGKNIQVELNKTAFAKKIPTIYKSAVYNAIAESISEYFLKFVSQKKLEGENCGQ